MNAPHRGSRPELQLDNRASQGVGGCRVTPTTLPGRPDGCPGVYWEVWFTVWVTSLGYHLSGSLGTSGSEAVLWVTGEGHRKDGCLEISSDTTLLGSQRNLKGPLFRQTRAIKLQSL